MDWTKDVRKRLVAFKSEQQLAQRAEEGWRAWFVNEGGEIDGWHVEEISSRFRNHMLCFESALLPYPYVSTSIDLFGPNGDEIGLYRLITLLDGELTDDSLEIDCTKNGYQERHSR